MKVFENKNIVITGAASGLGKLLVKKLLKFDCHLMLIDRNPEGLSAIKKIAEEGKAQVSSIISDLSCMDALKKLSAELKTLEVDILINNAGVVSGKSLVDLSDEEIHRTYMVNSIAPTLLVKSVLPFMLKKNAGHIVNLCSASSFVGVAKLSDYAASKAALYSFDESLRLELKKANSSVITTTICPYYINTGMFEGVKTRFPLLLPLLKPELVVEKIYQAICKKKNRIILPWFVYTTFLIKLLPPKINDSVLQFFGINSSMDDFKGRKP